MTQSAFHFDGCNCFDERQGLLIQQKPVIKACSRLVKLDDGKSHKPHLVSFSTLESARHPDLLNDDQFKRKIPLSLRLVCHGSARRIPLFILICPNCFDEWQGLLIQQKSVIKACSRLVKLDDGKSWNGRCREAIHCIRSDIGSERGENVPLNALFLTP
ncbi:hypothetical protein TNIN_20331 [Trichonephila inaurata madagascariensis]|uniref:Uncharacterized protein n=1 Tax=Trichonephila inaurata madagascariensis TaxID=2747483 RepID=A0A8X6J734_9ARAC|nr:hypothetical protein TNIN_20331 [Trichonephila inaurata madagascariensis]